MTAQFAKDQVSFVTPANLSAAAPVAFAPEKNSNKLRATVAWVSERLRRRAVIEELGALSERELADIGLTRSDIPRVFDHNFVATRSLPRAA